jgi:hypothetical protein
MEANMFSEMTQAALRRQGWSPERKVSTSDWVSQLIGAGFTVTPEAELILKNFGGLEITPVKMADDAYAANLIRFDPITDVVTEVERIEFWQHQLGQHLTPIGVLHPSEAILLLGADGQVFCEWGNIIGECGRSFEDALESTLLFARRKFPIKKLNSEGRLVPA